MLRSQIREEIFKILFRISFVSKEEMSEQIDFSLEELSGKSEKNLSYIRDKANAVIDNVDAIDRRIETCCEGWNLKRLGKAELTIMRLAVYEIEYEKIADRIVINEAVELAKQYCDEEASGFINAVLGKIVRSTE